VRDTGKGDVRLVDVGENTKRGGGGGINVLNSVKFFIFFFD